MKRLLVVTCLLGLAACGADGPPTAPQGGIAISGEAQIGIATGNAGRAAP